MNTKHTHCPLIDLDSEFMTGRIELLKDGDPLNAGSDAPEIDCEHDQPDDGDQACGACSVNLFQLPNSELPETFVCDVPSDNEELAQFSSYIASSVLLFMFISKSRLNPCALLH